MNLALIEGQKGLGLTSPNPAVGAVIVDSSGTILGKGFHAKAGGPHAEVVAIKDATQRHGADSLRGATIYITLEPCSTTGKTPPCCQAIIDSGISTVYAATTDPWPAHQGQAEAMLNQHGITYTVGLLQQQADELLRFFRSRVVAGRPWVIAKSAITLDGHTTLPKEYGQWISSVESREDVQTLRRQCDAILVGGETVRQDNPMLTLRGDYAKDREQPERIVYTKTSDLPKSAKLFTDEYSDRTHVYHDQPLRSVLEDLASRGISSVLLESGGILFSHALEQKLIDEVVLYIAPMIGGGDTHLIPRGGLLAHLTDLEIDQIGCDIRLRAKVR